MEEWKFQASIHGIDLGKAIEEGPTRSEEPTSKYAFRDPNDYEDMTEEEKEKLTQEMMQHWGPWAKQAM